jgi:AraC family transcriptional regulator
VSAATDTFARFLSVLEEAMTGPAAPEGPLASRLHLSRSHAVRLVSAAAGEPPEALRRRILLERAAYRLITSDHDVLRVAVEAGYGSHEAFTRAFARAYGRPPSQWRHHPAGFRIEAPSGVHFHPPGGLRVPAHREVAGMELLTRMVEHHIWLVGEMPTRVARLPAERLEVPIRVSAGDGEDDSTTLRSLLARLVGQLAMWHAAMNGQPYDMAAEDTETVADLRAKLARAGPAFLAEVREVGQAGRLDETFVDAVCEPPEVFTYGGMVAHVLTFAVHRRSLALQALAGAGITDLGFGDPMRWVDGPAA